MTPKTRIVGIGYGKKNYQISIQLKKAAAKVVRIDEIPAGKRATAGKKLIELKTNDIVTKVVGIQGYHEPEQVKPLVKRKVKVK
jgi:hypothetical protein